MVQKLSITPRKILLIMLIMSSAAGINSSYFPNVKALQNANTISTCYFPLNRVIF